MIKKKVHPWYKFDKVCSYNGTYNFIIGGRGLGKTYGGKKMAVRKFLKNGEQFIYLRRYKTELVARNTFFADFGHEFPKHDFRVNGHNAEVAPITTRDEKKREWQVMGYFVALSTSQNQKSIAFPRVTSILFDEFIIEKGAVSYLQDESNIMNNFYNTVDRYQEKTKVYFLANSVSIMNPYFMAFDIYPEAGQEILIKHEGFVVVHLPKSEDFSNSVKNTAFGRFIAGTEYEDYAIGNEFKDNHDNLLEVKDPDARYLFTLETKRAKFSIWRNSLTNQYFAQEKLPKAEMVFTMDPCKMDDVKTLMTFSDKPLAYLRSAFRAGRVSFDKPSTRNNFIEIFKR